MDAVVDETKKKEEESCVRGKEIAEEDVVPESEPTLNEEYFLKAITVLGG